MKRLIVCCDGTWQNLETNYPTNVVKIVQAIKPVDSQGIPQIVFYDDGVGSLDFLGDRITGGAFGWGLDRKIQHAYLFLCTNYCPGDEIYLFGFSRGAYTVRSLAGFIYCSGLLERNRLRSIHQAYQLYRDRSIKPNSDEANDFREEQGERVPITVLGCWDTVGALGIPNMSIFEPFSNIVNGKYRFHDTTLNRTIQRALHAVAIDERRKIFDVTPMQPSPHRTDRQLYQQWFPGTHGCVGGGTKENAGLSDGALQWMIDNSKEMGLEFNLDAIESGITPNCTIDIQVSGKAIFNLEKIWRKISDASALHENTKRRWRDRNDYRPENLRPFASILDA